MHSHTAAYVEAFILRLANKAHPIGRRTQGIKKRNEELVTVVRFTESVKLIAISTIQQIAAIAILFRSVNAIVLILGRNFRQKRARIVNAISILKVVNVNGAIS